MDIWGFAQLFLATVSEILNLEGRTTNNPAPIPSVTPSHGNLSSSNSRHRGRKIATLYKRKKQGLTYTYETAVEFLKAKKKPDSKREDQTGIVRECCKNSPCSWHERYETAEDFENRDRGWEDNHSKLCEASVRENHRCFCSRNGRQGEECPVGGPESCPNPCIHGTFHCGSQKCIAREKICDHHDDCGNARDEIGCTIKTLGFMTAERLKHQTFLKWGDRCPVHEYGDIDVKFCHVNPYYGNVEIWNHILSDGKYGEKYSMPVCDKNWDDRDAKVLCRTKGYSGPNVKAIAFRNTKFGFDRNDGAHSPYHSIYYKRVYPSRIVTTVMTEVKCTGDEEFIGDCPHKILPIGYTCGMKSPRQPTDYGLAGVMCFDSSTLMIETDAHYHGRVMVLNKAICSDGWTEGSSQVVCTQVYMSRFPYRNIRVVPLWKTTYTKVEDFKQTSIRNVQCEGTEANLSLCPFEPTIECASRKNVYVYCAICNGTDLVNLLASAKLGRNTMETRKNAENALDRLESQCYQWDCSAENTEKKYPEYCKVKAALQQAIVYMNPSVNEIASIQTTFDYGDRLKHVFMKQQLSELVIHIDNIGKKVDNFQTKLAEYFEGLAVFDKEKADFDLGDAKELWLSHERQIARISDELSVKLKDIFDLAFSFAGYEIVENTANLAIVLSNQINPVNILGKGATTAFDVVDAIKKLMNSIATLVEIGVAFQTHQEVLAPIIKEINKRAVKSKATYNAMWKIINSDEPLTEAGATEFLKLYGNFEPSVKKEEIVKYHSTTSVIISTCCDAIDGADTMSGTSIKLAAAGMGACPKALPLLDVLASHYESSFDMQEAMAESIAQYARAIIAEQKAISLSKLLASSLDEQITIGVAKMESRFLMQLHKEELIRAACSYITYMRHGTEEPKCTALLENTFLDLEDLVSFNYHDDMCTCHGCTDINKFVVIPAAINNGTTGSVPPGTIDLTALYTVNGSETHGSTNFRIPNRQWLIDNHWILEKNDDGNPLFLKSLQLFVPPGSSREKLRYTVHTSVQHSRRSTLNGKEYDLPPNVMEMQYEENVDTQCTTNPMPNAYNILYCPEYYKKVCVVHSSAYDGPIYPRLVGPVWNIRLYSNTILTKPSPAGNFFLRAHVRLCKKAAVRKQRRTEQVLSKPQGVQLDACCVNRGMAFGHLIDSGLDPCQSCTLPSFPRMKSYYCELCEPGFEQSKDSFGCTPCPIGEFKSEAGRHQCARCDKGKTTLTTGQLKCVKVIKPPR